jgi:hypothetical protein
MRYFKFFLSALILFSFTSCIEIIDDVTVKNDGSGSMKYTINLSASKVKINTILALDSLDHPKNENQNRRFECTDGKQHD